MITRKITHKYTTWDKILDGLVDAGCGFYELYGDIEAAVIDHMSNVQSEFTIELTASKDAWDEYDQVEKEVLEQ